MKYITDDGTTFDNYDDAKRHEEKTAVPARTVVFAGHSDDIVIIEDDYCGNDEFYCKKFKLVDSNGDGFGVTAVYDGCWSFAVSVLYEDKLLPAWFNLITFKYEADGYVCALHIDLPKGIRISPA